MESNFGLAADTVCYFCRKTSPGKSLLFCGACLIRGYCCKEHQVSDWKNHKPECLQFRAQKAATASQEQPEKKQQLQKKLQPQKQPQMETQETHQTKANAEPFVTDNEDLQMCYAIWNELDANSAGFLEGTAAHSFVDRVASLIIEATLNEDNLKQLFQSEYNQIALPPPAFFTKQREDSKKQFQQDCWKKVDPQGTGKISWSAFVEFFSILLNESI